MEDVILVVIIVALLGVGVYYGVKHFKGEGGCCGGGTYKARKKKLTKVIGKKTFSVEGMTCEHCKNRVMEAVNSLTGASADVKLKKGIVLVSYENEIEDTVIISAIEKAGYNVKR